MTTTTNDTTVALITGANKGIGFETARQLLIQGWTVWIGARDPERGRAATAELGEAGDARFVQIDVTDDESVSAAVGLLDQTGLDVLINNAGVGARVPVEETTPAHFLPVYGVNVLGPVRVTQAFLLLLRRSADPRIVNVSSGMGSFALRQDPERLESRFPGLVYASSKAALNMITAQYAAALPEIRVTAVDPGHTATDLNGHRGAQTVEQGAAPVVAAAMSGPGGFVGAGGPIGW